MTTDLTYTQTGMFTQFYAETEAGKIAWDDAAEMLAGNFQIFNQHLASTIYQLKKAGYTVSKAKKTTLTMNDIFLELDD
jgi:hypothetical protein